ncbi:uncharacterized protein VTP21DRAFT_10303 [Calcarisporiella thermophila]|uniref:uncharacterized protein n=1 Tax=Calcarisporiella thermophila TaxID=911321 RepID=UPI0037422FF7
MWQALPKIYHGQVTFDYAPEPDLFPPPDADPTTRTDPALNHPSSFHKIRLNFGETIYALEQCEQWFRGYVIDPRNPCPPTTDSPGVRIGIFPMTHVHIIQHLNDIPGIPPWKLSAQKMSLQSMMSTSSHPSRAALHKQDQILKDNETGQVTSSKLTPITRIHRQHAAKASSGDTSSAMLPNFTSGAFPSFVPNLPTPPPLPAASQIFFELKACAARLCARGETAELLFSLYNAAESRYVSEEYVVVLTVNGIPQDESKIGRIHTLFTDQEITPHLYLVCHIIRVGYLRAAQTSLSTLSNVTEMALSDTDKLSVNGSLLNGRAVQGGVPLGEGQQLQAIRRPVAVCMLALGSIFNVGKDPSSAVEQQVPLFFPINESKFARLHEDILAKNAREYEVSRTGEVLCLSLRLFKGEADMVVRENPSLMFDAPLTRTLGLPDIVLPGFARNDFYIRVCFGNFPQQNRNRNIQFTAEVRLNSTGEVVEEALSRGAGEPYASQFDSVIYYHSNNPYWNELIKVRLPENMDEPAHIFFTFYHRYPANSKDKADKPFAFSFLPIFQANETCVADGKHVLVLYRWDLSVANPSIYRANAWTLNPLESLLPHVASDSDTASIPAPIITSGGKLVALRDTVEVQTLLCSTQYVQNEVLLQLLRWKELLANSDESAIRWVLSKISFVPEIERVRFLTEVLDALFGILLATRIASSSNGGITPTSFMGTANNPPIATIAAAFSTSLPNSNPPNQNSYTNFGLGAGITIHASMAELTEPAFDALVSVLGIVHDRRFRNFDQALEIYAEKHFAFPGVHPRLILCMCRLLENCSDHAKELRRTIKVWPQLLRFVMRSHQLESSECGKVAPHSSSETMFRHELSELFERMNALMVLQSQSMIGSQVLALNYFVESLSSLSSYFRAVELFRFAVKFIDSMRSPRGQLLRSRLLMIIEMCRGPLLEDGPMRSAFVPAVSRWVGEHLRSREEGKKAQEDLRLCILILAEVLERLCENRTVQKIPEDTPSVELTQENANYHHLLRLIPKLVECFHFFKNSTSATAPPQPTSKPTTGRSRSASNASSIHSTFRSNPRKSSVGQMDMLESTPAHADIAAVFLELCDRVSVQELHDYVDTMTLAMSMEEMEEFLHQLLSMCLSILTHEVFPDEWLNVNVISHSVVLKILHAITALLNSTHAPPRRIISIASPGNVHADMDVWTHTLLVLLRLLTCDNLHAEKKQQTVQNIVGDLRADAVNLLQQLWDIGNESKKQFSMKNSSGLLFLDFDPMPKIANESKEEEDAYDERHLLLLVPDVIKAVLELCLMHHEKTRKANEAILMTIMEKEHSETGEISLTERVVIQHMDSLLMADGKGDDAARWFLITDMLAQLQVSTQLDFVNKARALLTKVNRLLELLLHVRDLPAELDEYQDDRIMAMFQLMKFVQMIEQDDIYVKYLHELVRMHVKQDSFVEAAHTLRLYANLLPWRTGDTVPPGHNFPQQSSFARKEMLYYQMMELFEKGQAWEDAVGLCKELAHQYEHTTYDYARLAEVLRRQANLCDTIIKQERHHCEYFRVRYVGHGFPVGLRGKQFIYRGLPFEKLSEFCERIQIKHPKAQLLGSHISPGDAVVNSEGQYLYITAVVPEPDRSNPKFTRPDVPHAIRDYHEHFGINTFSFSRPMPKRNTSSNGASISSLISIPGATSSILSQSKETPNDFVDLWIERTELRCEDAFPFVLRRSEVVKVRVEEVSPIQNAIAAMQAKNQELLQLEERFRGQTKSKALNLNPLTMALNGAVDAPVNGGVAMYKQAFFSPEGEANAGREEVEKLRRLIEEQVVIIQRCLQIHDRLVSNEMRPLHDKLVKFFKRNFYEEVRRVMERNQPATENSCDSTILLSPNPQYSSTFSGRSSGSSFLDQNLASPNLSEAHPNTRSPSIAISLSAAESFPFPLATTLALPSPTKSTMSNGADESPSSLSGTNMVEGPLRSSSVTTNLAPPNKAIQNRVARTLSLATAATSVIKPRSIKSRLQRLRSPTHPDLQEENGSVIESEESEVDDVKRPARGGLDEYGEEESSGGGEGGKLGTTQWAKKLAAGWQRVRETVHNLGTERKIRAYPGGNLQAPPNPREALIGLNLNGTNGHWTAKIALMSASFGLFLSFMQLALVLQSSSPEKHRSATSGLAWPNTLMGEQRGKRAEEHGREGREKEEAVRGSWKEVEGSGEGDGIGVYVEIGRVSGD